MHTHADLERIDKELALLQQQHAHLAKRIDNLRAVKEYVTKEIEKGEYSQPEG